MKKLFTLLLLSLTTLAFHSKGQSTVTCNLQAKFSFERDPLTPNKVKFTNLSTPATDIKVVKWIFGDGTSSTELNPYHVYTKSGLYKVCLIVKKDYDCTKEVCMELQIQIPPPATCNFTVNFAWQANSTEANKIHFTNLSTHLEATDEIKWTFGDGTFSTDVNPTHTYNAPGTYNVCIRVKKNTAAGTTSCVKEICKQVVVQKECRLEANFSFEADAINKNKIYFKNTSTSATAVNHVQWSFGDGTFSNSISPEHVYAHPGTYRVCLNIYNTNTCYREICKTVEIKNSEINCLDISKFTFTRTTANCLEFKFIPAVQNPDWKYVWSFGDGTGSTNMNPSHVYPRQGKYTAYLTIYKSSNCVSTFSKIIETGACIPCHDIWAKFKYQRESYFSNRVYFYSVSNYPIASQKWTITKLSSGAVPVTLNQNNPVYIFNEPGDYRVCLRAVTKEGCVKEYCEVIRIASSNTNCVLPVYPNPAHSQVSINAYLTQPSVIHVYIYNSMNILVKRKDQSGYIGDNVVTTNIEGLVTGWYIIKVMYGNRVCYSRFQKT